MVSARIDEGRPEQWGERARVPVIGTKPAPALVDVLNGFVKLAGDRYRRDGLTGEAIRVYLHLDERLPVLHIADYGSGLAGPDLHKLARRLLADATSNGNSMPGKLDSVPYFGAVAEQCEVISLSHAGQSPWRLSMTRGFSHYTVRADPGALRALEGTDVYLRGVDAALLGGATAASLAEALQSGNHGPLLEGAYTLQVCSNGDGVWVSAFRSGGIPLVLPPVSTAWGPLYVSLSSHETAQLPAAPIILRGDRGQLVLGAITSIPGFDVAPWTSGRLSGEISFPCLHRNPLQPNVPGNRQRLAALSGALDSIQPQIQRLLDEHDAARVRMQADVAPQPDMSALDVPDEPDRDQNLGAWGLLRAGIGRVFGRIKS